MRFWHQSSTDLTLLTKYRENICNHAKQVLDPGIMVEPYGFPTGTRPAGIDMDIMQYPYIAFQCERIVCEAALTAEREGYDALTIGCNLDIGLRTCRSIVDIPVVGVTESSMHAACLLGKKFAFITISSFLKSHITTQVEENGLEKRLACVLTMKNLHDNQAGSADSRGERTIYHLVTEEKAKAEEIFLSTCEEAIAMGADVLIPGEGILNEFVFERGMTHCGGIPILDANAALWHCGTMLAKLRSRSSINTSRGFAYLKPDDELMNLTREFHKALSFSGSSATDFS